MLDVLIFASFYNLLSRFIPNTGVPDINNTPLGLGTSIYQLTLPPNLIDEISVLLIAET
jgi:hypothetical protein